MVDEYDDLDDSGEEGYEDPSDIEDLIPEEDEPGEYSDYIPVSSDDSYINPLDQDYGCQYERSN